MSPRLGSSSDADNKTPVQPEALQGVSPGVIDGVHKSVSNCVNSANSMPATFNGASFLVPPNGGSFPMSGFTLNFQVVNSKMTLTATPISATPKSDIEFRYGTTIYTLKAPQEATAVPIDGKIGLGLTAAGIVLTAMASGASISRRNFFGRTVALTTTTLGATAITQAQTTTDIRPNQSGVYTIAGLPINTGTSIRLTPPTLDFTTISLGAAFTGRSTPGAQVVIQEGPSTWNVPVGPDGRWSLVGLPAGTHTLTLRTEDSNTGSACIPSASIQATVTVTALIVNNAPTFPPIAPIPVTQGTAGSTVLPPATDVDGDPITYSLTGLLPGITFDPATRTLTWTAPAVGTVGAINLSYTANDGKGGITPTPVQINVTATPNTAPVPTFLGFTVDASLTMNASGQLTATDGNNDPLTYAITAQPSAGTITTNASGAYTYTGRVLPGTYSFTYTVTDGKSTPVARTATITVNDVAPVAPNISPVVVNDRGGGLPITPFSVAGASDPFGRTFAYSYTSNTPLPTGLSLDPATGIISGTHDANGNENYTLQIRATRGTTIFFVNYTVSLRINDEG